MAYVDMDKLKRHVVLCFLAVADRPLRYGDLMALVVGVLHAEPKFSVDMQLRIMVRRGWIGRHDDHYHMQAEGFVRYMEMADVWKLGYTISELCQRYEELEG